MGEAVAIHLITALFRSAKQTLIVNQAGIVNADDIQRYNLMLVRRKSVNIWTRRLGEDLSLDEPSRRTNTKPSWTRRPAKCPATARLWLCESIPPPAAGFCSCGAGTARALTPRQEASTDERFLTQLKWPAVGVSDSFHVLVGVNVNDGIPQRPEPIAVRIP
jgi:hypothetical protein